MIIIVIILLFSHFFFICATTAQMPTADVAEKPADSAERKRVKPAEKAKRIISASGLKEQEDKLIEASAAAAKNGVQFKN